MSEIIGRVRSKINTLVRGFNVKPTMLYAGYEEVEQLYAIENQYYVDFRCETRSKVLRLKLYRVNSKNHLEVN